MADHPEAPEAAKSVFIHAVPPAGGAISATDKTQGSAWRESVSGSDATSLHLPGRTMPSARQDSIR